MPKRGMTAKMYKGHYTLLGRAVWHLCKLDITQLRNLVKNITQLTKVKPIKKRKSTKSQNGRRTTKPTAKQLKARKLFAMRAKRGDFR